MRTAKILVVFGIMVFITGCVPSLHPLFIEKDLVFEPTLVGTWTDEGGNNTWYLQKSKDNAYKLKYTENEAPAQFEAHLLQLDKLLFIDLFPEEPETKNDFYKGHLILAHSFARIWINGDVVRLAMLDDNWLKDMIKKEKVKIGHEWLDKDIILTASTKDLQKFVLKYAGDDKAFSNVTELQRQK